jgi:hypothetical protein
MLTDAIRKRTTVAVAGAAILVLAMLPTPSAHALAPLATATPPVTPGGTARLERVWLRQQTRHDRLGVMFNHVQQRIDLAQQLIDRAKANGKDVTALQTALDGFSSAVQQSRPIYEGMQGIFSSHQGFDANGNVTDVTLATGTVRDTQEKFQSIRDALSGPAKTLRDAVRSFRQANQPTS